MSTKLRSHGKSTVVWIMLAMIIVGLGGFGVGNFSGQIQSIGSVGDTQISVNDYAREFRAEMNAAQAQFGHPLSKAEALDIGLDRAVQGRLFGEAAMAEMARRLTLSVGDAEVSRQITAARAFQGPDGKFDRETYKMALRQEGYTEAQFETRLRSDIARSILQGAVAGGVTAPTALTDSYTSYLGEARDLSYAEITAADLPEQPATPDEATLKAWYDAHLDQFTKPETREISYVWLTPEMLRDKATVDDATLQATYQERINDYVQPERRHVLKLVFPTAEEAKAGMEKIDRGEASLTELAQERGLSETDIDLGEVSKADLGTAGDAVFALQVPGVVGPVDTDLGPAILKMDGITAAETTSFEEAKPDLVAELSMDRARRMIGDMTADLEDRLASGATLEDMAKETDMAPGHISMAPDSQDGIAAYESFRDAAAKVTAEDFPELGNLEDGGVFALRLDGTTPAAPIPFAEVKDKVLASWTAAELVRLKTARAEAVAADVAAGKDLGAQGLLVTQTAAAARTGFIEGVPPSLPLTAFATEPGKAAPVVSGEQVFVVAVTRVIPADPANPYVMRMHDTVAIQLGQSLGDDLIEFFARAAENEAGLTLDSTAISAVQAQIQ